MFSLDMSFINISTPISTTSATGVIYNDVASDVLLQISLNHCSLKRQRNGALMYLLCIAREI